MNTGLYQFSINSQSFPFPFRSTKNSEKLPQNIIINNAFELKGVGINRWEPLFFDPQKNAIEPFRRIGDNTVLHTLDQHVNECGNV